MAAWLMSAVVSASSAYASDSAHAHAKAKAAAPPTAGVDGPHSIHGDRGHAPELSHRPGRSRRGFYGYPWGPGLGVSIRPRTEHWAGNYRPDTYTLPGYDGQVTPPRACRGETGTTLSTTAGACPEGQQPDPATRRWSTSQP